MMCGSKIAGGAESSCGDDLQNSTTSIRLVAYDYMLNRGLFVDYHVLHLSAVKHDVSHNRSDYHNLSCSTTLQWIELRHHAN